MSAHRFITFILIAVFAITLFGSLKVRDLFSEKPVYAQATEENGDEIDPTDEPVPEDTAPPEQPTEPAANVQQQTTNPAPQQIQEFIDQKPQSAAIVDNDVNKVLIQAGNSAGLVQVIPFLSSKGYVIGEENGLISLVHNDLKTVTGRPLFFDTQAQTLSVQGTTDWQQVDTFPDEVVKRLVDSKIIEEVADDTPTLHQSQIELFNDRVVYITRGVKIFKVLGLIKIPREIDVYSNISTGNLIYIKETSWLTKAVDLLSTD